MNYDERAFSWDTERRTKRAGKIAGEIARELNLRADMTALEFGCGTGLVSFFLRDRFKRIALIDASKGMIDVLNQKIMDAGCRNMTALCTDICAEPGASPDTREMAEAFDVIYTSMAIHHVKEIETALERLCGLLKPAGRLCIVDLTEDDGSFHKEEEGFDGHNGFDPAQLKEMLEEAGFHNVTARVFYEDRKMVGDIAVPYSLFIMTGEKWD